MKARWLPAACALFAMAYVSQLVPHAHEEGHPATHSPGAEHRGHHAHHSDDQHGHAHSHHSPYASLADAHHEADTPRHPHHHHVLTWHLDLHSLRVQAPAPNLEQGAASASPDVAATEADQPLHADHWNPPPGFSPVSSLDSRGPPQLA